ncbi:hypothetical protein PCE1_004820 [Barthelona sp. PCE]
MLPLTFIQKAIGSNILLELKNGDSYGGLLSDVDTWMNLKLENVIITKADGSQFYSAAEVYARGAFIKNIRFEEQVLTAALESVQPIQKQYISEQPEEKKPRTHKKHFNGKGKKKRQNNNNNNRRRNR